jgi:polyhydroxybutyrate depolymerase
MKSGKWNGMRAASAALLCLAMLALTPMLRAQETKEKLTVDDVDRTFMLRLPKGFDAQRHYPVVMLLHGLNQDADDMERLTQFDQVADKDGIIAVYPIAMNGRWNIGVQPEQHRMGMGPGGGHRHRGGYGGGGGGYPGGGGGGGGYPGGGSQQPSGREPEDRRPAAADDIAFFNQLIDQLTSKFSADASRVYVAGLSEGGFMSLRLGCSLGDRIAAVGAVGAAMPKTMICLPPRPVPLVMINGTADPVVRYGGGTEENLRLTTLSVEESAKAWAKIDRCGEKPEHSKVAAPKGGTETKVDTYTGCHQDAQVVSYSLKGAGNTWPGGMQYEAENQVGKTSADFNANAILWSFLVTKKLPPKSEGGQ